MTPPETTIAAAEWWIPADNSDQLTLANRLVGETSAHGDQLARHGSVGGALAHDSWQQKVPLLCMLDAQRFQPVNGSAQDKSRVSVLALPCFAGDQFRGALVLCQHFEPQYRGAVELWTRDDREELGLRDSHYCNLELIARISPYVKFPRAAGLPGNTWDTRSPIAMEHLDRQIDFMRSTAAKTDGLSTGLAIPVMKTSFELTDVVLFLSSSNSPLARLIEIWKPNEEGTQLHCDTLVSGPYVEFPPATRGLDIGSGVDLAGRVLESGQPMLFDELPTMASKRNVLAKQYGLTQAISWPVYRGSELCAVVNLVF